eukprot:11183442-Alexandrium_andersonii.AAC.1
MQLFRPSVLSPCAAQHKTKLRMDLATRLERFLLAHCRCSTAIGGDGTYGLRIPGSALVLMVDALGDMASDAH